MGMFSLSLKESASILYEENLFTLIFGDEESVNESIDVGLYNGKDPIIIYVRNKKEASAGHYCSVKACKGGINSKKNSSQFVSYPVSGMDHPYTSAEDVKIDKHCKGESLKFDRDNGKIVKKFVVSYQKEIIDYWEADTIDEMERIKFEIKDSLEQSGVKFNIK